jgi:hypothetical protein
MAGERVLAPRRPLALRRTASKLGAGWLSRKLLRVGDGDVKYAMACEVVEDGRYFAAVDLFQQAERAYVEELRGTSEHAREGIAAASAMRAWALSRSDRLEQAIPILESLLAEINGRPPTDNERTVWPGQTVAERKAWLEAHLRWALEQTDEAKARSGALPPH